MDRLEKSLSASFREPAPAPRRRGWWRWTLGIVVTVLIVALYLWGRRHILYTSDAFVEANWVTISPEVAGHVSQVFVEDNQWVEAGEPLFEIDPDPYRYAVDQGRGMLGSAMKQQQQLTKALEMAQAAVVEAKEQLRISQDVWERNKQLVEKEWVSKELGVQYYSTYKMNEAAVQQAEWNVETIRAQLGPINEPFSEIVVAQAVLEQAEYNLNRTLVLAPTAGRVTDFYVRPGQYVEQGTWLFSIVDTSTWWITARYKDYTLANMEVGAPATIMVDMYWGRFISGTVEGIGWGVNRHQASPMAAASSLPYVEQTEFWIRLAQRFRVRITIDDPERAPDLRIGANCRVLVRRLKVRNEET